MKSAEGGFARQLDALRRLLETSILNGQFSERQLAAVLGVSQPHLHHVLHGQRALRPALADRILERLGLTLADLPGGAGPPALDRLRDLSRPPRPCGAGGDPRPSPRPGGQDSPWPVLPLWSAPSRLSGPPDGTALVPSAAVAAAVEPGVTAAPGGAGSARSGIWLLDRGSRRILAAEPSSWFAVRADGVIQLAGLRYGNHRIYLLDESTWNHPHRWMAMASVEILAVASPLAPADCQLIFNPASAAASR